MNQYVCCCLGLCASIAAPASGQTVQEPAPPEPPPPVFELTPEAYFQLDWRGYPESPVTPGTGRLEFNTFEVRRMRAGATGQWRGMRFELTLDPQASHEKIREPRGATHQHLELARLDHPFLVSVHERQALERDLEA